MITSKGNGLDAPHDQPAKTLTKYASDLISRYAILVSADAGLGLAFTVVLLQVVLTVIGGRQ